jgi:hypothetical protein
MESEFFEIPSHRRREANSIAFSAPFLPVRNSTRSTHMIPCQAVSHVVVRPVAFPVL